MTLLKCAIQNFIIWPFNSFLSGCDDSSVDTRPIRSTTAWRWHDRGTWFGDTPRKRGLPWHDSTSMTKEVDKSPTFGWTSKFNVFQVSERIMCWEVTQRVSSQEITTAMHKQVCLYKYWRVTIICVLTYCQETLSPTLLHIYRQWPKKRRQLL